MPLHLIIAVSGSIPVSATTDWITLVKELGFPIAIALILLGAFFRGYNKLLAANSALTKELAEIRAQLAKDSSLKDQNAALIQAIRERDTEFQETMRRTIDLLADGRTASRSTLEGAARGE